MREEKYIKRDRDREVLNGVCFFLKSNYFYWLIQIFKAIKNLTPLECEVTK